MNYDLSERQEALLLLQMSQGMRIAEVKFGPAEASRGYPHSTYDDEDEDEYSGTRRGKPRTMQTLKHYYYKCHDASIQVGDIVLVQVGYFYSVATVMELHSVVPPQAQGMPLKYVLGKVDVSAGAIYNKAEQDFMDALARSEANERLSKLAKNLGMDLNELKALAAPRHQAAGLFRVRAEGNGYTVVEPPPETAFRDADADSYYAAEVRKAAIGDND